MSNSAGGDHQSGEAEVGYHEDLGEVWVKMDGEKVYMQPDEAREFSRLLTVSADAAEGKEDD